MDVNIPVHFAIIVHRYSVQQCLKLSINL
ncbi:hypothetical protein KSF78_0007614 [Schistosoma japonicum]|nr:hypothetical protein KSF78_0007614 [Schistosoma japonicum]